MAGSYVFSELVPSAPLSAATGINASGQVVGYSSDTGYPDNGFSWQNGTVTYATKGFFPGPLSKRGQAVCLNCGATRSQNNSSLFLYDIDNGHITHRMISHGFFRSGGVDTFGINAAGAAVVSNGYEADLLTKSGITPLNPPEMNLNALNATGINLTGTAVGTLLGGPTGSDSYIFTYTNGTYTVIPAKGYAYALEPFVFITDKGVIYGGPVAPFTYVNGTFTTYLPPGGLGGNGGEVVGFGPSDEVIGSFFSQDAQQHGFSYVNGQFHQIDYPGASQTNIVGVSANGTIAGSYVLNNLQHAYVAICPAGQAPCTK